MNEQPEVEIPNRRIRHLRQRLFRGVLALGEAVYRAHQKSPSVRR